MNCNKQINCPVDKPAKNGNTEGRLVSFPKHNYFYLLSDPLLQPSFKLFKKSVTSNMK